MLNFSVFDNDETLGDITRGVTGTVQGAGVRHMTLQVTISFLGSWLAPQLSWFRDEASIVKDELQRNGWIVRGIARTSTNVGGVGAYTFLIDVELHGNFSDSEIVGTARSVLSRIGSDVRVSIARNSVNYVSTNVGGGPLSSANPATASSAATFFDNLGAGLGAGLGISSPVVLLAGGVHLIVLLKR
jgi:hypothetical protein